MLNDLLFISLAPVLIITFYIYSRDKYEKEPLPVLLRALLAGIIIIIPVVLVEKLLIGFSGDPEGLSTAAYHAFTVAGLTEETMKYIAFLIFFWNNRNFNEKFDGIVYAVYIALGFAGIENLLYVFEGGYQVGIIRALTAVPAHALFGIVMGYYFGLARFTPKRKTWYLSLALILPIAFHGLYDFLLMGNSPVLLTLFVPVLVYFWISGFKKMSLLSDASVFKKAPEDHVDEGDNIS